MMEWMLLPFKRYAEFTGRSRRKEYWMFVLLSMIIMVPIYALIFADFLPMMLHPETAENFVPGVKMIAGGAILVIWLLVALVPGIAVTVRRLHDRDMSGWWYLGMLLISWVPIVGFVASIAFLVVTCLPGTVGPNRFGADPLDPNSADVFA